MGLFDKLLNRGAQILGDAVSDAVSDKLADIVGSNDSFGAGQSENAVSKSAVSRPEDNLSFDKKMQKILANAGVENVRKVVSVDEISVELGCQLYALTGATRRPDPISYAVYNNGRPVLLIRVWGAYNDYNRSGNRQVIEGCKAAGITLQDYFLYLPNRYDYMEARVNEGLR